MAIEKMKKLYLLAVRTQKEAILRDLMLLGSVEIGDADVLVSDPEIAKLTTREESHMTELRMDQNRLTKGLQLMDKYAPKKGKLLAPRPEMSASSFLDEDALGQTLDTARRLEGLEDHLRGLSTEENRQKVLLHALEPWTALQYPLEKTKTARCWIQLGSLPLAMDMQTVDAAIREKTESVVISQINADKEYRYVMVIGLAEEQNAVLEALRRCGYATPAFSGMEGTPQENIQRIQQRLEKIKQERAELSEQIATLGSNRDNFKLGLDRMTTKLAREEAGEKSVNTETSFGMWGWVPASQEATLAKTLEKYDCAWETREPEKDEYPSVPIKLKNSKVVQPMNMVTSMYSLPAYDGIDPNPLMFIFFVFFFGFMFADIGYGLLILAVSIFLKIKIKPKGTLGEIAGLGVLVGISTTICGVLTGGFFGDVITVFAENFMGGKTVELWSIVSPLKDPMTVLVFGIAIGCVHLIYGQCIHIYMGFRDGGKAGADALLDVVPWWILFAGIGLVALKGSMVGLIVGVIALICTQGRHENGFFRKFFGGVKSLYGITDWLSDVLSYSRLMALMLATTVIASVVNILGALPGNVVVFFVVFLIGHMFNLLINIIGTYVHAARLQYLEFFGKFYKDGGIPFRPLSCENTKYVDVVADKKVVE